MSDIAVFLTECWDELEALAKAAAEDGHPVWTAELSIDGESGSVRDGNGDMVVYDEGAPTWNEGQHIAANDPRFVLADIAAKRNILEQCMITLNRYRPPVSAGKTGEWALASLIVERLAAPFASRPGYDLAWAVNL